MKKVAITGFAESTMGQVHNVDKDTEIWSLNYGWMKDLPRIDRLFEIHKYEQIMGWKGENDVKHREWLMEDHGIPVYMQDVYPEFPNSVKFPFEQITEEIFKYFIFFDEDGNETTEPYYTSTPAYMIGLAILEGFDIIEVYGIDMSMGTEWYYQKACMEFLIGFAGGRGITIRQPKRSKLLKSPLYAYGSGQTVDKSLLAVLREKCQTELDEQKKQYAVYRQQTAKMAKEKKPQSVIQDVAQQAVAVESLINMLGGYLQTIDHLDNTVDVIGRQTLEKFKAECLNDQNSWIGKYNSWQGKVEAYENKDNRDSNFLELTKNAAQALGMARTLSGSRQCLEHLIMAIDIEEPEFIIKDEFSFTKTEIKKEKKSNGRRKRKRH